MKILKMNKELNPVCKECNCYYPVEYSIHMDYCDECYKTLLKLIETSQKKAKKIE
jgi:hypothetical protein